MSDLNRDVQAGQQLLSIYERSKLHLEEILDRQPALFAIVNPVGTVFRTNEEVARFFGVPLSECAGANLSCLFSAERWRTFLNHLENLSSAGKGQVNFELPIDLRQQEVAIYWRLEVLRAENSPNLNLVVVVGQDISDLRRAEKQLSEVFATAPVGILTVEADGTISPTYSAYCEWLFDRVEIAGCGARDVIFASGEDHLEMEKVEAIENLFKSISGPSTEFEKIRSRLPTEIPFFSARNSQAQKWLHLTYHPVVSDAKIKKVLILIEDRTSQFELRQLQERASILNEGETMRIIEIKRCRTELLKILVKDFANIFEDLQSAADSGNWAQAKNYLHAIKGNARIVDFSRLASLAHDFETFLQEPRSGTPEWKTQALAQADSVNTEWSEIRTLIFTLHKSMGDTVQEQKDKGTSTGPSEIEQILRRHRQAMDGAGDPIERARLQLALKAFNSTPLSSMETKIRTHVERTAAAKGKEATLTCIWNDVRVNEEVWSTLSDSILHLVNNALAHGIESPQVRETADKDRKGAIGIEVHQTGQQLRCEVWDDGRGIEIEKVRTLAVQKRMVTLVDSLKQTPQELMQLVFTADFSTAKVVDQTAGRGVGLSSVAEQVRRLGGEIHAEARKPVGTVFQLTLPLEQALPDKGFAALSDLVNRLDAELARLNSQFGLAIPPIERTSLNDLDYIVYCALEPLTLALTTIFARYASDKTVDINLTTSNDKLCFEIRFVKPRSAINLGPEFAASLPSCFSLCFMHQGEISQREHANCFFIGQIIAAEQLPAVKVAYDGNLNSTVAIETSNQLLNIAKRFSIKIIESRPDEADMTVAPGSSEDAVCEELVRAMGNLLKKG